MDAKPKITWLDEDSSTDASANTRTDHKEKILDAWTKDHPGPERSDNSSPPEKSRRPSKKSSKQVDYTIDLHGKTLDEAKDYVAAKITSALPVKPGGPIKFRIITGKGHHNQGSGSILANEIQPYVKQKFRERIIDIQDSPGDIRSHGLPIRGHFDVVMK